MDEKERNWCLHKDTQEWFEKKVGNDTWLTVYKGCIEKAENNESPFIWSFLISRESVPIELSNYCFNQFDGYPCTEKIERDGITSFYKRYAYDDREPLFFRRSFLGKESYLEISQEFIHFFELYYDPQQNKYIKIQSDGNEEDVIRIDTSKREIRILLLYLKKFLAFKNMDLVIGVVMQRFFNNPINDGFEPTNSHQVIVVKSDITHYALWYQSGVNSWNYLTEFIGKKIIQPMPIEKTGIYPFEKEDDYSTFIIGRDKNSNLIEYSCNPENLGNNFGKNISNPHYLTPVYFSKSVLSKYYSRPDIYTVEDGGIKIGDYYLRADTNSTENVIVFLGDLGRDIPYSEQIYWKSFNIEQNGELSKTAFERSIMGNFADPESEQFIFRYKYEALQQSWAKKYGWTLFKRLNEHDLYRLNSLRIPLTENQQEFDQQVESLVVIIIDSINKSYIDKELESTDPPLRSIQSLESYCQTHGISGYEEHFKFLRDLYKLRSQGASHRKDSKDYPKIRNAFRIDQNGYVQSFREILKKAISLMDLFIQFSSTEGES